MSECAEMGGWGGVNLCWWFWAGAVLGSPVVRRGAMLGSWNF